MLKLFGFRITPFFLFILGLEFLAFIVCVYIGVLLYTGASLFPASIELIDYSFYSSLFLIILLSILTPGFFYHTQVINMVKNSINEKIIGLIGALVTMLIIVMTRSSGLEPKILFMAALFSACVGLMIIHAGLLTKYWRFLIRSGVN